jgi:hypothetical protein
MDTHTFTVVFQIPDADSLEPYLDAFVAAGGDDAAFSGPGIDGTFRAEFDREASSFPVAVVSALKALCAAVPESRPLRVLPDDLVTISAIASRLGRSDESVRLLQQGKRGPGNFPPAASWINEKTQVWRWTDVADWFNRENGPIPEAEHAYFLAALNHVLELHGLAPRLAEHPDELAAVAHFVPRELEPA